MKPLKDRRISRLNYVDTELLESLEPSGLLLTLANKVIRSQASNAYSLDWLLMLDDENIRKLICGSVNEKPVVSVSSPNCCGGAGGTDKSCGERFYINRIHLYSNTIIR